MNTITTPALVSHDALQSQNRFYGREMFKPKAFTEIEKAKKKGNLEKQ